MELDISPFVQILCIVKGNHFHSFMLSGTTAQNHRGLEKTDAGHTQFLYIGHVLHTHTFHNLMIIKVMTTVM